MKDRDRIETSYYSNGNRSYEIPYVNDKANGLYKWWYENGNKWYEIPYKNNLQHGSSISFNY